MFINPYYFWGSDPLHKHTGIYLNCQLRTPSAVSWWRDGLRTSFCVSGLNGNFGVLSEKAQGEIVTEQLGLNRFVIVNESAKKISVETEVFACSLSVFAAKSRFLGRNV